MCVSVFDSKYTAKKGLFSNPTNDAEEHSAPPLPSLKPVRWFSNRFMTSLEVEDTGPRKKDICNTCLIILCFSVLMGLFFPS